LGAVHPHLWTERYPPDEVADARAAVVMEAEFIEAVVVEVRVVDELTAIEFDTEVVVVQAVVVGASRVKEPGDL
jgi:hypothetical protein